MKKLVIIVGLLVIILIAGVSLSKWLEPVAKATDNSLVARQTRTDDCVLASVATSMNYKSGSFNYTSPGLQLAYKIKYGSENWAQDDNTSHNAQMLALIAGFQVEYGKLGDWGGVAALKYLVWAKRYPVVFLKGSTQHAITVLSLVDDNTFLIADSSDGNTYKENVDTTYNKLESQGWYFALD